MAPWPSVSSPVWSSLPAINLWPLGVLAGLVPVNLAAVALDVILGLHVHGQPGAVALGVLASGPRPT